VSDVILDRRDLSFQLFEVLDTDTLFQRPRFAEHSRETIEAALDTAEKLAREKFANHNSLADKDEPTFVDGKVVMRPEVKTAFDAYINAGFLSSRASFEEGGMQLPEIAAAACKGMFTCVNPSSTGYAFLTAAAANVIRNFASDTLRSQFLEPMMAGRFTGTMALTEPHAGSSLADIRTRAVPQEDGSYRLKGNKIFISGGDHPLSDNIVHMVLAKLPDAPAGVKGISLFIVPKFLVNDDGSLGERNDVTCVSIEHKIGIHGSPTCVMAYGEQDECIGEMIGGEFGGIKAMFTMMNNARINVGSQGVQIGERATQQALYFAMDRVQSARAGSGNKNPVAIIEHPDVRRMLLRSKALTQAARALLYYATSSVDRATLGIEGAKSRAEILTPLIKGYGTDIGNEVASIGVQIHGGMGMTDELGVGHYVKRLTAADGLFGNADVHLMAIARSA